MEKGILYLSYIVSTTLALMLSLRLLGFRNLGLMGVAIGVINGTNDFFIKEVLNHENFFSSFHIVISIIIVTLLCYRYLRLNLIGALVVPCLAYILTAIGEIMMLIFIISLADKSFVEDSFKNIYIQLQLGVLTQLPLILAYVLLKFKFNNFTIYNLPRKIREKEEF